MNPPEPNPTPGPSSHHPERSLTRALVWIGVAGLTAGVAFAVARALIAAQRPPDDPTSLRIQQLIDEANALLKTLDEQKHSA